MAECTWRIAEMDYTLEDCKELRDEIIELRDGALSAGNPEWAVTLSHVIAFMAVAIAAMYPPTWQERVKALAEIANAKQNRE